MSYYIDSVIVLAVISVILYSFYQDRNNVLWTQLASCYKKVSKDAKSSGKSGIEMVFFWRESQPDEYDYLNSMKVNVSKGGLAFLPTFNHLAIRPVLIPWSELEIVGVKRLWLQDRLVLSCENSDIRVTILSKWEAMVRANIEPNI